MSEPSGNRCQILLVDDEPALLEAYAGLLTHAGYEVQVAGNGTNAIHAISQRSFDVVLTDIGMPGMDGLQLLRTVRERDLDVPVILMTGNPNLETAVQALEDGALRYLMKPLREQDLLKAVGDAVALHGIAVLKREALTYLGSRNMLVGDRAGLEVSYARALDSLRMVFQPIVHAADGAVFGHEALVRTGEPPLAEPEALFDAAERLGRVRELGRLIRERVAESMTGVATGGQVFVNLHSEDFEDDSLFSADMGLAAAARSVVLEVTERAPLDGIVDLRGKIATLRRLGYRVAIDDLGAGYAGLNSFATLQPEVVKLDMALVRGIHEEEIKQHLVGSMTTLCKELGILVVAEGVETAEESATLKRLGCDLLQGFLFGRPEPGRPSGRAQKPIAPHQGSTAGH